jgi:hypothetical protein
MYYGYFGYSAIIEADIEKCVNGYYIKADSGFFLEIRHG